MGRYPVTCGCGFIGSSVVNSLLERGEDVFVIDDLSLGKDRWETAARKPTLLVQDILDADACDRAFRKIKPQNVIHLAAQHFVPWCEEHIYEAYALNVTGTLNVLEGARRYGVQDFFLASTGEVTPELRAAPGSGSDRAGVCIRAHEIHGRTNVHAVFRIQDLLSHPVDRAAVQCRRTARNQSAHACRGHPPDRAGGQARSEVGNLWPLRDYVDVDSMGAVIIDALSKVEGLEILNIGSGHAVEVREALSIIASVLPFKVDFTSVPRLQRPNDRPFLCPDIHRLRRTIGRAADSFNEETARRIFAEYPNIEL